jgi:2,4-dienoyl-CoA reductase-like NADH-dependent reductase (Old Yellow Enzyme family)
MLSLLCLCQMKAIKLKEEVSMPFKTLLSPIRIGSMEVKNRFVVPPMGTCFANQDATVSQRMIDYYSARAKGGFGLITIEVTAVAPEGEAIKTEPGLFLNTGN